MGWCFIRLHRAFDRSGEKLALHKGRSEAVKVQRHPPSAAENLPWLASYVIIGCGRGAVWKSHPSKPSGWSFLGPTASSYSGSPHGSASNDSLLFIRPWFSHQKHMKTRRQRLPLTLPLWQGAFRRHQARPQRERMSNLAAFDCIT